MCGSKLKLVFLLALFLSFSFSAFSQEPTSSPSVELPSALLAQPLPEFPVADLVVVQPSPTPTSAPLTLNERTARQLEAWIAYQQEVKAYVLRVNDWSSQVTNSWEAVKASSTNYEEATRAQIEARDDEIVKLHGDVIKYAAGGFLVGLVAGFISGALAF